MSDSRTDDPGRRKTVWLIGAFLALVLVAVGTLLLVESSDGEGDESVADTTALPAGWQPTDDPFPPLAYIACCGSNWDGEPSPAVPTDPTVALAPGIYNAQATPDAGGDPDSGADGVLSIDVRPYERCADLAEFDCNDPFTDAELGVAREPARTIEFGLDDSLDVAVAGFVCDADEGPANHTGTGLDLEALSVEVDADYESVVARPIGAGADPTELAINPAGSFHDLDCPAYGALGWTSPPAPTLLVRGLARLSDDDVTFEPLPSAVAHWLLPTAVAVDDAGRMTLYLYGGFLP